MRVLRRFLCLPLDDRWLLFSAALVLGLVGAALRLVSFKKCLRWADKFSNKSSHGQNASSPSSERISWAVAAVGRRIPFVSKCLVQAVATQILLARWGHPALMRIGVTRGKNGQLEAHAWVESPGAIVMGAPAAGHFIPLADIDRGSR
jgi:Transglutaminase-like superfamily